MTSQGGILFCMRYPDDEGFVWKTVARLRDMVAAQLPGFDCLIAFPRLTGRSVHRCDHLDPVELDAYTLTPADRAALRQLVTARNLRAIVYMSALPTMLDLSFLRGLGLVTVNTEEDSFHYSQRDGLVKRSAKFVLRRVLRRQLHDLHIANSVVQGEWLKHYAQIPASRLRIIPNGVDCAAFTPASADDLAVLDRRFRWVICASQARAEKRVDLILRCAARILAQPDMADVRFVYVGDGAALAGWQELAQKLGLAERFVFAGQQDDLRPYYRSSVLMVHAAERESFGLVVAEAMACGLPVVASAAAGPCEIVADGVTGALVPIDDEAGFGAAIEGYLRDPDLMGAHGRAGRERVAARFSIDRQARAVAEAIRGTLR